MEQKSFVTARSFLSVSNVNFHFLPFLQPCVFTCIDVKINFLLFVVSSNEKKISLNNQFFETHSTKNKLDECVKAVEGAKKGEKTGREA